MRLHQNGVSISNYYNKPYIFYLCSRFFHGGGVKDGVRFSKTQGGGFGIMIRLIARDTGWREGARYRRLRGIDRTGLLWEFLRRDPAYIDWYARTYGLATDIRPIDGALENTQQLGIHFR